MNRSTTHRMKFIAVAALGFALAAGACSKKEEPQAQFQQTPTQRMSASSAEKGGMAPDFNLQSVAGNNMSLENYKGNVIMLNFWATWCGPCKREIPDFIELQKSYGGKGFKIVGIALDDPGDVRTYTKNAGINYDVLFGSDEVAMKYGNIRSIPTTFLIDREGKIVSSSVGLQPKEKWVSDIEALL